MEFKDQPIDAALAAWKTLSSLLATTCANNEGRLDCRRAEEFGVLIQEPPRALGNSTTFSSCQARDSGVVAQLLEFRRVLKLEGAISQP